MTVIGELAVNAVVITEGLEKGSEHFRREVGSLAHHSHAAGVALAALGATAAFTAYELVHGQSEIATQLDKTSRKMGVTVETLSELRFAGSQAAHMMDEQFDSAMQMMQIQTAKAAEGGGKAVKTLEKLGLSAAALNEMSADKKLGALAVEFEKVHNPATRLAMAVDIFGKKNADMALLLEKGAEGLAEYRAEAVRTGAVIDGLANEKLKEAHESADRMHRSWEALKHQLGGALAPVFTELNNELAEDIALLRGQNPWLDAYEEKLRAQKEAVDAAAAAHKKLNEERERAARIPDWVKEVNKSHKAEYDQANRDREQQLRELAQAREGNATFGMTPLEAARFHRKDAYNLDVQDQLIKELEIREKLTAEQEKANEAKHREQQMLERAKSLLAESLTPLDKLRTQLSEISQLQTAGKLTADEAKRAAENARAGFAGNVTSGAPAERHPALAMIRFGSAEAYRAIHESRAAQETKKVSEKQLKELEKGNQLTQELINKISGNPFDVADWN